MRQSRLEGAFFASSARAAATFLSLSRSRVLFACVADGFSTRAILAGPAGDVGDDAPGLVANQSRLVAERCDAAICRVSVEKRKCATCA